MGVELRPTETGFDVFGLDRRYIILEGSIPSAFEEGSDDYEAADGDKKDRGGGSWRIEGFMVEAVPSVDQRCCRRVAGFGSAIPDEVIDQRILPLCVEGGGCLGG